LILKIMHVRRIKVTPPATNRQASTKTPVSTENNGASNHQMAYIIDGALSEEFMTEVDEFRQSLPLDAKRPTVKRRFFSSALQCPAIRTGLLEAIEAALEATSSTKKTSTTMIDAEESKREIGASDSTRLTTDVQNKNSLRIDKHASSSNNHQLRVHILAYMRFLEYDTVGGHLDPHTDGNKICEDTGYQSTHTMLLYLRDCDQGGQTLLLEPAVIDSSNSTSSKDKKEPPLPPRVVEAVQPKGGRILLFPHPILHEGAPVVDAPKLCLRAEVALFS